MEMSNNTSWSFTTNTEQATEEAMAICEFNGMLYIAFKSSDDNQLYVTRSKHGVSWSGKISTKQATSTGPTMCVFKKKLYIAFKASDKDDLLVISSEDGINWGKNISTNQGTSAEPAMCVHKDKLYIVFKASDDKDILLIISSDNGTKWSNNTVINEDTSTGPSICSLDDQLYIIFKASGNNHDLLSISSTDGLNWTNNTPTKQATDKRPAICKFNNQLYVLFKSSNSDDLFLMSSDNGTVWSTNNGTGQATSQGAGICHIDKTIYIAFKSSTDDSILCLIITNKALINTAHWMGGIHDQVKLNQLVMPGSHDAGMSETNNCLKPITGPFSKTQNLSIGEQLMCGSRYFDIRVEWYDGKLLTYHKDGSLGCNGQSLLSIFNEAITFLNCYPNETFIFKFSHTRGDETKEKINEFLYDYEAHLFVSSDSNSNLAELRLGDLRGKIIVVIDYIKDSEPTKGRWKYADYCDDNTCEIKSGSNLTVFDDYSNTDNLDLMMIDQLNKWEEHAGLGKKYLFLLSWTLTWSLPSPQSIKNLADEANTLLPQFLFDQIINQKRQKPNIVYIDFLNPELTQSIIQYNSL